MITVDEYVRFAGKAAPEGFPELSGRSWAEINRYLLYGLTGRNPDVFPDAVKNDLLWAQVHQIDYLAENEDWLNSAVSSCTLGKFSVSGGSGESGQTSPLSGAARTALDMVRAYLNGLRWYE